MSHEIENRSAVPEEGDEICFAGQIGRVIKAGLPLESGLRALAEQTTSYRTRRALMDLSDHLRAGMPLDTAMQQSAARLPRSMSALIEAGMETGRLDTVMLYSVEQSQRGIWLRQQIWTSLAYPLFLLWSGIAICSFILIKIIPDFRQIFDDFGIELPGLTVALISVSKVMTSLGWTPVLVSVPVLILFLLLVAALGRIQIVQLWVSSIPFFGRIFHLAALSDFCQILAILLESKLPFPKALRAAAAASNDSWLQRRCQQLGDDLENGVRTDQAATEVGFPTSLCQVFRHASSERTVTEALRGLSDMYAARCNMSTRLVTSLLEPFVAVSVMAFAGLTAIAVFMPLIKLLNDLS